MRRRRFRLREGPDFSNTEVAHPLNVARGTNIRRAVSRHPRASLRGGFSDSLNPCSLKLAPCLPAWRVSRLSECPCTEIGFRWRVFRVPEPACRQFATATRETCRQNPETRARRRSNSENPPRGARFAARRPANSENLPTRGVAATATRKTRQARRGPATRTRKTCQLGSGGRSNPENLPAA